MIQLSRLNYETQQIEGQLNNAYMEKHGSVIHDLVQGFRFPESKHIRWMSASIWFREQTRESGKLSDPLDADSIREELSREVRAILSDYGNLSMAGLRLFLIFMGMWLLFQEFATLRLTLRFLNGLLLGCMILYPIGVYTFWNRGSIHPFKALKLILGTLGTLAAGAGIYLMSLLDRENPIFEGVIVPSFNLTEFLILVNLIVILSFIIHFRRVNLFSEVCMDYQKHLVSLSGLSLASQAEISHLLKDLDAIPLKTHTKRRLKVRVLEEYSRTGTIREAWLRDFIRVNCIDMNWIYWAGSTVQWSLIILLISKLIWAHDTGLMVSTDYFRQTLTTGMVFGALLMSAAVLCPLNRIFRKLLYTGASFSLKQIWQLAGLSLLCGSVLYLSGLVPSRFIWGEPVNPAPHAWGFIVLLGLVLLLQLFKSDQRFQHDHTEEK